MYMQAVHVCIASHSHAHVHKRRTCVMLMSLSCGQLILTWINDAQLCAETVNCFY